MLKYILSFKYLIWEVQIVLEETGKSNDALVIDRNMIKLSKRNTILFQNIRPNMWIHKLYIHWNKLTWVKTDACMCLFWIFGPFFTKCSGILNLYRYYVQIDSYRENIYVWNKSVWSHMIQNMNQSSGLKYTLNSHPNPSCSHRQALSSCPGPILRWHLLTFLYQEHCQW